MRLARAAFGSFFIVTGILHFVIPGYFVKAVPSYLPAPAALVALSGAAEIAGGVGLMLPRWRVAAGIGLIVLLIAVFPANVEMLRQAKTRNASTLFQAGLWLRLPLQALLIWGVWRVSRRAADGQKRNEPGLSPSQKRRL